MTNLNGLQEYNIFESFAAGWQDRLGTPLLLFSAAGQLIASSTKVSQNSWQTLFDHVSPTEPTVLTYLNQTVVTAPLIQNNHLTGYLLALGARGQDAALLAWGAEMMIARLEGEEALQDMTDELIGAWNQLELIYRVTQDLSLTTDLLAVLQSILQEIRKVVHTEDAFILLERPDSLDCVTSSEDMTECLYSPTLLDNLMQADHIMLCENTASCRSIWPEVPDFVETMLATELPVEENVRAVLGLVNKVNKHFTAGDSKLLTALAQQVGTIVRNVLLHQNVVNEERLSRELEIAAEIQKSLLPTKLPQVGGLSIAVSSIPASEVERPPT